LEFNQGRGAARVRAMKEANFELVLGCDASLVLDRNFLSRALPSVMGLELERILARLF
jgi:hypothetical protein